MFESAVTTRTYWKVTFGRFGKSGELWDWEDVERYAADATNAGYADIKVIEYERTTRSVVLGDVERAALVRTK